MGSGVTRAVPAAVQARVAVQPHQLVQSVVTGIDVFPPGSSPVAAATAAVAAAAAHSSPLWPSGVLSLSACGHWPCLVFLLPRLALYGFLLVTLPGLAATWCS